MAFILPIRPVGPGLLAAALASMALAGCAAGTGPEGSAPTAAPSTWDATEQAGMSQTVFEAIEGQWAVRMVGDTAFPGNQGLVNFQSEDFFSHEAGCGGGHPAFYEALPDGELRTSRREAVIIGKCPDPQAASLERLLADFIDRANGWDLRGDGSLVLSAADGTSAVLRRPTGPRPELQGEWRVLTIGGTAWDGPQPARIAISYNWIGGGAGCNSGGATYTSPEPGRLVLDSLPTTLRRCEDALMRADALLFGALRTVTGYAIDGDRLTLTGPQALELEFEPG